MCNSLNTADEYYAFEQFGDVILFNVNTMKIHRMAGGPPDTAAAAALHTGIHRYTTVSDILNEMAMADPSPGFFEPTPHTDGAPRWFSGTKSIHTIGLNVAEDCNLRCSYCYRDGGPFGMAPGRMDRTTAEKAIDLLFDISAGPLNHIYFFGGEPLLNVPAVIGTARYVREKYRGSDKHPRLYLVTNGTLVSSDISKTLKELDIQMLVGIDGPADVHDDLRCGPHGEKTYDVIESHIRSLPDGQRFGTVTVLSKRAVNLVNQVEHLRSIGCNDMVFKLPMHLADGADEWIEANGDLLREQLSRFALFYLDETLSTGGRRRWNLHKGDILFDRLALLHAALKLDYPCDAGLHEIAVSANGDIYPCPYFTGMTEFRIGDVWSGIDDTKLELFIEGAELAAKSDCARCWARYLCGGGCPRDALGFSKKLDQPNPLKCDVMRHIARLSIYLYDRLRAEYGEFVGLYLNPEALELYGKMCRDLPVS